MAYFNNETTRKLNIIFASIFNKISVVRTGEDLDKKIPFVVPIDYAPSQKYLARNVFEKDIHNDPKVAIQIPCMSYEITELNIDESRLTNKNARIKSCDDPSKFIDYFAPYVYSYRLYIYSRTEDDLWQITEQILPLFNKTLTITSDRFNDFNLPIDLKFELINIELNNNFEGDFTNDNRTLYNVLNFKVPITLFGGSSTKDDIITRVITNLYDNRTYTPPALIEIDISAPE